MLSLTAGSETFKMASKAEHLGADSATSPKPESILKQKAGRAHGHPVHCKATQ